MSYSKRFISYKKPFKILGDNEDALGAILLGVLGLAAIAVLLEKKCPYCNKSQLRGTSVCTNCNQDI